MYAWRAECKTLTKADLELAVTEAGRRILRQQRMGPIAGQPWPDH